METFKDLIKHIIVLPIKKKFHLLPKECLRKTQFTKIKDVEAAARRYNMKSYLCPHCRYFHLSKK